MRYMVGDSLLTDVKGGSQRKGWKSIWVTDWGIHKNKDLALEMSTHNVIPDVILPKFNLLPAVVKPRSILICGDGDLSYGASFCAANPDSEVTVTVLEPASTHSEVYAKSNENMQLISATHKVMFGVDATSLADSFPADTTFDKIVWNFPHWPGKSNIRRNRELLGLFFASASKQLSPGGSIDIALTSAQLGMNSKSLTDWKASWQPTLLAASHGMVLTSVSGFEPTYNLSSHRGVDRGFPISDPVLCTFTMEGGANLAKPLCMCSFHELHVTSDQPDIESILKTVVIPALPDGFEARVSLVEVLKDIGTVVYKILYTSTSRALSHDKADALRGLVEESAMRRGIVLRKAKVGGKPCVPMPRVLYDKTFQV